MAITLSELKEKIANKEKHKFNAKRCEFEGIKFPSKLERDYYLRLVEAKKIGEIQLFLRQVPFDLPGNVKYIVDFVIFYKNSQPMFVDVKGKMTPMSILKIKQVEALYPVTIKIVDSSYMKRNLL